MRTSGDRTNGTNNDREGQIGVPARDRREQSSAPRQAGHRRLILAGLFAGIGGIEKGFGQAGHECALLSEIDVAARAVLDARFPEIRKNRDVTTLRSLPREVELLVAGFPCQDLSQTGKTAGITGSNSGLVLEIFRLLRRRLIPWLLLENVSFMLHLARGRALELIVDELESLGYRWAYRVVDTQAFGLPQRRERVFLVASLESDPREVLFADEAVRTKDGEWIPGETPLGFYWTEGTRGWGRALDAIPTLKGGSTVGVPSPPAILLPDGEIVIPGIRDAERLQGFPRGWTEPAERVARPSFRWKLVGNAVSVPVARWLGYRFARPGKPRTPNAHPLPMDDPWPRVAWNVGAGRFTCSLSSWPVRRRAKSIREFLRDRSLLSRKATQGFYDRILRSSLDIPDEFKAAVDAHRRRQADRGISPAF